MKLLILLGLASLAIGSPVDRLDGKIVGGKDIEITDVPYQVSIFVGGRFFCGGSIISKDYVLTAGHCSLKKDYTIRAGSKYTYIKGSTHTVTKVVRHESFGTNLNGILHNDIALMKVSPPFTFDETRQTITLIGEDKTLAAGVDALVTGWGRLSEGGATPTQLQAVKVPLITKESCQEQYKYKFIARGQICAAYPEGGKDACQGDSGGPLAVGGFLAGIVSWGYGCARPSLPGVYTEVAYFRNWIRENSGV